jgi:hypothetical protein
LEKRPKIDFLNSISDGRSETTTASSSSRRFHFATHMFVLDVTWVIYKRLKFGLEKKKKRSWSLISVTLTAH